jgi:hypothetical protein
MEPKLHGLFMARAEMHQQLYTHRKPGLGMLCYRGF